MTRITVIAWREFRATVFTWAFLLSVALLPIGMVGFAVVLPLFAQATGALDRDPPSGEVLVVAGPQMLDALEEESTRFRRARALVPRATDGSLDEALVRLRADTVLAVVAAEESPPTLYMNGGTLSERNIVRSFVGRAEARRLADDAGQDVDAMRELLDVEAKMVVLSDDGTEHGGMARDVRDVAELGVAMGAELLLWLGVFVSAQYLLQTTIEERSSKIMEVLLSAVSPMQLMAGKIVGLGFVGLLMTSVYGITMLVMLTSLGLTDLLSPWRMVLFGVFYVLAYVQMGSVFAAIGSAVNELREAQSLMTPAVMTMTVPFMAIPLLIDVPNGGLAVALSLTPPISPYTMIFRLMLPANTVPAWEIAAALVVSTAWAALMLWGSTRVFRIGVLMRGKAPGFFELWRWIRVG